MKIDRDTLREVAETIGSNKRRSIATAFGVFWGMFILVILLSLSSGLSKGFQMLSRHLAPNMICLKSNNTSIAYDGFQSNRYWTLQEECLDRVKRQIPELASAEGLMSLWAGDKEICYEGKCSNGQILGVSMNYFSVYSVKLLEGRMLNAVDYKEQRRYALIGNKLSERLFGVGVSPIGKHVLAQGRSLTIVGLIQENSDMVHIASDFGDALTLPLVLLQNMQGRKNELDVMAVSFHSEESKITGQEKLKAFIKKLNHIAPQDEQALNIFDIDEILNFFKMLNGNMSILIWIVGIGTLITGIVGISNILLVTVKERTSEIGIRRALGAQPKDIITQLILESLSLTLISGLLGIMCSVGIMSLVAKQYQELGEIPFVDPIVNLQTVCVSLLILVFSGVLAGLLPAVKAIEIKAIEAIREE